MASRIGQTILQTVRSPNVAQYRHVAGLARSVNSSSDILLGEEERKEDEERRKSKVQAIYSRYDGLLLSKERQKLQKTTGITKNKPSAADRKEVPQEQYLLQVDMFDPKYLIHGTDQSEVQPALKAEVQSFRPEMVFMQNLTRDKYQLQVKLWMIQLGYTGIFHLTSGHLGQATFYRKDLMSSVNLPLL